MLPAHTAILEVHNLRKSYGGVLAVEELNLILDQSGFVTLLGPSGCGKTTTLRCIGGLEIPDAGRITLNGLVVSGPGVLIPPHQRALGMVFQSYAIWPHMTVESNVAFPLRMRRVPKQDRVRRAHHALEIVGLSGLGRRYPAELSGGQQQRVALARAVVSEPSLILYDEPLSNLDAKLREEMRFWLRELHGRIGAGAIFVTHDQEEALVLSDQICVMRNGKIEQTGTPSDIYQRPASRFVAEFVGSMNVLHCEVSEETWDEARLANGVRVKLKGFGSGTRPASIDSARVAIRPHHIQLRVSERETASEMRTSNTVVGTVTSRGYLGSSIRFRVALDSGESIFADVAPPSSVDAGDVVEAYLPPEHCMIVA